MAVLLKRYSLPAIPVIIIILMVMIPVSANGTGEDVNMEDNWHFPGELKNRMLYGLDGCPKST
ncbi:MAG: hypothetical protein U9N40_07295 [Euryarchaeota archaeon]|nr:hypothetical protein [Euryarchaeota archaeon]